MRILLLLVVCVWPSIDNLPADYAGDVERRRGTQRHFLLAANDDPCLATRLWYEHMIAHYTQHDPICLPEVVEILDQMQNHP